MKQIIFTLILSTCLSACAFKSPCSSNTAADKAVAGQCVRCAGGCACDKCECQKTGTCTCDKCENCPCLKGKGATEAATGDAAKEAQGGGAHKCPSHQAGGTK